MFGAAGLEPGDNDCLIDLEHAACYGATSHIIGYLSAADKIELLVPCVVASIEPR